MPGANGLSSSASKRRFAGLFVFRHVSTADVRPPSSTELVLFRPSLVHDFAIAPLLVIDGSCTKVPICTPTI